MFDIETAPIQGCVWSMWKQNVAWSQVREDWYMLTWAAKWLDEEEIMYDSLHHYKDLFNDEPIVQSLHALLDEADIVIAHNGNKFDIPKVNARFITHGMQPPSPYRSIDTLAVARQKFRFTSNRLDVLGDILGVGRKVETGGFQLWARCLDGDPTAFQEMADYNIGDITLLEDVYLKLRPWMSNHPNINIYDDEEEARCPKCQSAKLHWRGHAYTQVSKFHRFQCQDCGAWGRSRVNKLGKGKRQSMLNNIQGG